MKTLLFLILSMLTISSGVDTVSKSNNLNQTQVIDTIVSKKDAPDISQARKPTYQLDTVALLQINQNTKETAENTYRDEYEKKWAFPLSIAAFLIAILTLMSQMKTRKNTQPVFTSKKQYEVLVSITDDLIEYLLEAYAVLYRIYHSKPGHIPSELLFPLCHIDSKEIHLELFYYDKKQLYNPLDYLTDPTNYSKASLLKDKIEILNEECKTIARQIQEKKFDIETIKQEYSYYLIQQDIFSVLESVEDVVQSVYAKSMKGYIAQSIFIKMLFKHRLITENLNNDPQKHLEFVKQFEDNYSNIKEDLLRGFAGIDELVDGTEDNWNELFKDFDLSQAITTLKEFNIDRHLDFVKLMVVGILTQEFKETPYISY